MSFTNCFICYSHEENNVNQSQIDLEKQLEEIAQPYQISSCNLTSARKYLSTAFFFAESATTGTNANFLLFTPSINHLYYLICITKEMT